MFRLDGRVALVVGAASGIGRSAALGLADFGALVCCADLNRDGVQQLAAEIKAREKKAETHAVDLLQPESVRQLVGEIHSRHGRLDIVVATPGVNVRKALLDYTDEEFDRVVGLNLKGTLRILRECGRVMAEAGKGSIVLLSSIRSQVVEPGQGVYAATKAGIVQMARALAAELGPCGVRVNVVAPGVVDTPLTAPIKEHKSWHEAYAAKSALGRWARADEMVGPIVFLCSDASSYVTGAVLFVDGGWTAIDGRFSPPLSEK